MRLNQGGPPIGGEYESEGTQESCSARELEVSFQAKGVSFQVAGGQPLWLRSFLVVCTWLSQGEFQQEGLWEVGRIYEVSFLFLTFPEFFCLVVAC